MQSSIYDESVAFSSSYSELIQKAYDNNHLIYITTLTWIFKVNVNNIDLIKLHNNFNVENVIIQMNKNKQNTQFYNQITLKFVNISTKSIKIFKNGQIQVTGLSSYFESIDINTLLLGWLNEFIPLTNSQPYEMINNSQKIAMINLSVNTYPTQLIKLTDFCKIMKNDKNILRCTYNPENYRGVNVKLTTGVSMFVFHTGNIIMSNQSIHNLKDGYMKMYKYFLNRLKNENKFVCKKNIENSFHGYDMKDVMALLVPSKDI